VSTGPDRQERLEACLRSSPLRLWVEAPRVARLGMGPAVVSRSSHERTGRGLLRPALRGLYPLLKQAPGPPVRPALNASIRWNGSP
jgi:hypothetical protein